MRLTGAFLSLGILLLGCIGTRGISNRLPPSWMRQLPQETGVFYARGFCPRTYSRTDAVKGAIDDALTELARRLEVEVKSLTVEVTKAGVGSRIGSQKLVQISQQTSNVALLGAEVLDWWYDVQGQMGEKETTYALVRWTRGGFDERLTELLKRAQSFSDFQKGLEEIREEIAQQKKER